MSIKDDILETKAEVETIKQEESSKHSLAYEILTDYKKTNKGLIITNILLLIALIITIIVK